MRLNSIMVSKREQITTSAITFLSGKPLASMEEIAKAAGIGRATLFRYFNNRQALVDELELECKRRLNRAIAPYLSLELPADQLLYQVIKALIPLGDSLHFLFFEAFNINNPQVESAFQDDIKIWERLIVQLQEEGLINSNLSHRWIARTGLSILGDDEFGKSFSC